MLTHEDLNQLADRIEKRVDKRCGEINERLDTLNGRTRKNEREIAVLQDRSDQASDESKNAGKNAGAKWGAWTGGAIGAAIVTAYKLLAGGS
jgi:tetrahydromethanopterin S-methyltransferase subunit G